MRVGTYRIFVVVIVIAVSAILYSCNMISILGATDRVEVHKHSTIDLSCTRKILLKLVPNLEVMLQKECTVFAC